MNFFFLVGVPSQVFLDNHPSISASVHPRFFLGIRPEMSAIILSKNSSPIASGIIFRIPSEICAMIPPRRCYHEAEHEKLKL